MPSEAAYYKGLLNSALSDAKSELDICNNVIYHGDSHTALETYYNKYIDAVYNSPSPYLNAAEELNTATSILYTRRLNIDSYGENINKGYEYLGQCEGNKYEADQAYIELKDLCEKYSAIDCSSLSDQDLASVLKEITTIVSRGENIISCVDALTHAITKGLSAAKILNVENSILNIAANCITDDNDIRTELNRQVMRAWYKAVADNELSFDASTGLLQVYDEIEDYYENDSIDFSGFLRNPNLYTTYTNTILFDDGKFPGWTTYSYVSNNDTIFNDVDDYTINTTYAWEPGNGTGLNAEWAATSAKPVVDTQVSHVGGTGMIVQTVEN